MLVGCHTVVLCFISAVFGAGLQPMVGRGILSTVLVVYPSGLPEWATLGLGWVVLSLRMSGGFCPALLSGSTTVLEGVL